LALSEAAQRQHKILNASLALYYKVNDDGIREAGKRLRTAINQRKFHSSIFQDMKSILLGFPLVGVIGIRRYILGHEVIHQKPVIRAVIDLEQVPRPESRVYLSNDIDRLGMRKAVVDWKIGELERRTAKLFADFLDDELRANDLGRLKKEEWLTGSGTIQNDELNGNLHFIGATRMAANPESGVVDVNCRVFGIDNLYVAGTSVFPTGGHANPMITIVALAIRLSDHLKTLSFEQRTMSPADPSSQGQISDLAGVNGTSFI
jgi:choline dehydrogenase-like flavoprotein